MEPLEELSKNNSKRIASEDKLIQNLINLNALKTREFNILDNSNKCEELTSKQNYRIEELENKIKKLNENPGLDIEKLFEKSEDSSAENKTFNRITKVSLITFPFLIWVISFYFNYQESKNINEIFLQSYSIPDSLLLNTDFIRISGLLTNDLGSNNLQGNVFNKHSTSSPNIIDTIKVNHNSLIQPILLNNRSSINADFNLNSLKLLDNQHSRFQSRNFINYCFYFFVYLVFIAFIWLDNKRERYRQNYTNKINSLVHILNSINSSNTLITRSEYRKLWDQVSSQYLSEKYHEPSIIDFVKNLRKS